MSLLGNVWKRTLGDEGVFGDAKTIDPNTVQHVEIDQNKGLYGGSADAAGKEATYYKKDAFGADNRNTGHVNAIEQSYNDNANQARNYQLQGMGNQQQAMELNRQAATGSAPSVAAKQMAYQADQNRAALSSAAGSARGAAGLAMAQQNAQAQMANQNQANNAQMGMLRAQEMAQARGTLGQDAANFSNAAGNLRGSDQAAIQSANQFNVASAQSANQGRAIDDARYQAARMNADRLTGMAADQQYRGYQSQLAQNQAEQNAKLGIMKSNNDAESAKAGQLMQTIGQAGGAITGAVGSVFGAGGAGGGAMAGMFGGGGSSGGGQPVGGQYKGSANSGGQTSAYGGHKGGAGYDTSYMNGGG